MSPGQWPRAAVRLWRRSLQVRVIGSTLVVTALVVAVVGALVVNRVSDGVLESQRRAALAEMRSGLKYAGSVLADVRSDSSPQSVDDRLETLTKQLAGRVSQAGTFDVVVLGSETTQAFISGTEGRLVDDIPERLRQAVARDSALAYSYARLGSGDRAEAGLVVGAPVYTPTRRFELYYLFSLRSESSTISLAQRTLLAGGAALSLLGLGIAGLLTRQVVTPVRLAARTAERFAAGQLQARMSVHGNDELARLGEAFNEMAASLHSKIDQLQGLSRLQQRFVSDVSHELRTPLTTVRMAADVLHASRTDFPPEVARSAELLQRELDRFEALLSDLLEISRFDAGAAVLDAEAVELNGLVRRVVEGLVPLAARRGSEVVLRTPPGDVLVEADARRIERVLRNLLANAIEYGESLPVEVTVGTGDDTVAVVVRDHGIGLRPGEASRVFNRFWRADLSRTRQTGGTGLGLSIAFEDVRLHGGWLQAWGEPDRGAVFRVTLPCHVGGDVRSSPLPLQSARAGTRG